MIDKSKSKNINEFYKLINSFAKDGTKTAKNTTAILALTKKQVSLIEAFVKSAQKMGTSFVAEKPVSVFKSKKEEKVFNDEMIKVQDNMSKVEDEQLETLQDLLLEQVESNRFIIKRNEKTNEILEKEQKKHDKERKKDVKQHKKEYKEEESWREDEREVYHKPGTNRFEFVSKQEKELLELQDKQSQALNNMNSSIESTLDSIGVPSNQGVFAALKESLRSEKGFFNMGILGKNESSLVNGIAGTANQGSRAILESEKQESFRIETEKFQTKMLDFLDMIAKNTKKQIGMLKGGSIADLFKKLWDFLKGLWNRLPLIGRRAREDRKLRASKKLSEQITPKMAPTIGLPIPGGAKIGGLFAKAGGALLITAGIGWFIKDFMEGFAEGGLSSGFKSAFIGEMSGELVNSVGKNMGKYALIGAGIGLMGGPVGVIGGALLGAGIGGVINWIGRLFDTPNVSTGTKIADFLMGGTGLMGIIGGAGKWAVIGAAIGSVVPVVGTIAGAIIGAAIGAVLNFIKQLIPGDVIGAVGSALDSLGEVIASGWRKLVDVHKKIWDFFFSETNGIFSTVKDGIYAAVSNIKKGFGMILNVADWIAEKLGLKSYWDSFKSFISDKFKVITDFYENIFNGISNFISDIWSSFKGVLGKYWERIKAIFGMKGKLSDTINEGTTSPTERSSSGGILGKMSSSTIGIESKDKQTQLEKSKNNQESKLILEKNNDLTDRTNKQLDEMNKFQQEGFVKSIAKSFETNIDKLIEFMRIQTEQQRMYDIYQKTGTLKDYGKNYMKYEKELQKMSSGAESGYGTKSLKQAITQVNKQETSIVNNVLTPGLGLTLRKAR